MGACWFSSHLCISGTYGEGAVEVHGPVIPVFSTTNAIRRSVPSYFYLQSSLVRSGDYPVQRPRDTVGRLEHFHPVCACFVPLLALKTFLIPGCPVKEPAARGVVLVSSVQSLTEIARMSKPLSSPLSQVWPCLKSVPWNLHLFFLQWEQPSSSVVSTSQDWLFTLHASQRLGLSLSSGST